MVLSGDEGDDVLTGTNTADTLRGGDGDDLMIYENGDGTDDLFRGGGVDTTRVNGAPDRGDEFAVEPTACTTPRTATSHSASPDSASRTARE